MRRALLLLALSVAPAAAEKQAGSLAGWRARLDAPVQAERRESRERLLDRGPAAGPLLLALSRDASPRVRREAARGLARIGGDVAIERLIVLAFDGDPLVAQSAASGLAARGAQSHGRLLALQAAEPDAARRARLQWLAGRAAAGLVEARLQEEITSEKGIGAWEGKFRGLERHRAAAAPALLALLSDERASLQRLERDANQLYRVRELALMALAQLGDRGAQVRAALERVARDDRLKWHHQGARAALYSLGHPRLLEARIAELTRLLAGPGADADERRVWLDELASCYYTKREFGASVRCYEAILRVEPADYNARYNLACSQARLGQLDRALASLERAVEAGFLDVEHIMKDGDLKELRKNPRFAARILAHPRLRGRPGR